MAHRSRRRRGSDFAANALWWAVSFLLHMALLAVLAQIEFRIPPPPKDVVEIQTGFVEILERLKPITKRNVFAENPQPTQGAGDPLNMFLATSRKLSPMAVVGKVGMADIDGLFKGGSGSGLGGFGVGTGGAVQQVRKAVAKSYDEAIDDFAAEMIDILEKQDLLLVLLFDESKSLKDDRQLIMAKLDSVTKTLDASLEERQRTRLKWSVVSYGRRCRLWLKPTSEVPRVRKAIDAIREDPSGEENLIAALRYCLVSFAKLRKPTFIVLITDEAGTDVGKSTYVEETVAAMVRAKFRVSVFGREAAFASYQTRERYSEDGQSFTVLVDKGPESAVLEFFPHDEVFVTHGGVPSGYAMYAHARMAAATGGQCYLLADKESPYDDRLLEELRPELCSRREYAKRTQKSKIRRTLSFVLKAWEGKRPAMQTRGQNFGAAMQDAVRAQQFCSQAIRQIKKENRYRAKACKYRLKRWQANYDLTYAQLHKFRFMLRQYCVAVQRGGIGAAATDDEGNRFIGLGIRLDKSQPLDKDKEAAQVQALFAQIEKDYERTPWAVVAKKERESLARLTTYPRYERKRQAGERPIPKL